LVGKKYPFQWGGIVCQLKLKSNQFEQFYVMMVKLHLLRSRIDCSVHWHWYFYQEKKE